MTDWVLLEASVVDNESTICLRDVVVKSDMEPIIGKNTVYSRIMLLWTWGGCGTT
jgi:hypothetical protein